MGIRTGNGPTEPLLVILAMPASIRQMSVEVPPASSVTTSSNPAIFAITTDPRAPAAGPDSAVVIGLRTTCWLLITPPEDCITRKGFSLRPEPSSSLILFR